jgi:hypothetical protein
MPERTIPRRFVVTVSRGGGHLPAGTTLEEIDRVEHWDHHGCIDSARTTIAVLRILEGDRLGEVIRVPRSPDLETWLASLALAEADPV